MFFQNCLTSLLTAFPRPRTTFSGSGAEGINRHLLSDIGVPLQDHQAGDLSRLIHSCHGW
jgi:hypothetical protein